MISNQNIDWYIVDEDLPEGTERLLFAEPNTGGLEPVRHDPQHAPSLQHRIYELAIAFVFIYSLVAFFVWQVVEQRMSSLEGELLVLSTELAKQQAGADQEASLVGQERPALRHTLETDLLRFEFGEANSQIVRSIAALCTERYRKLHADFGLILPVSAQKLTISVVELPIQYTRYAENRLNVPSPEVAAKRYNISEAEALKNEIYVNMSRRVLAKAISLRKIKPQWLSLVGAIGYHFWLDDHHDNAWRHNDLYLARRYAAQTQSLSLTYSAILYEEQQQGQDILMHTSTAENVSDPLIEYILVTYGDSYISQLLDAFEQHESWDTLAPALLHMPARELETQWHSYIDENNYGSF